MHTRSPHTHQGAASGDVSIPAMSRGMVCRSYRGRQPKHYESPRKTIPRPRSLRILRGARSAFPRASKNPSNCLGFKIRSGNVLLSRGLSSQVPSALEGLTSVFGMGTGVSTLLWPPGRPTPGSARDLARPALGALGTGRMIWSSLSDD